MKWAKQKYFGFVRQSTDSVICPFDVGHFVFVVDGQILANYQWNNYGNDNKHIY